MADVELMQVTGTCWAEQDSSPDMLERLQKVKPSPSPTCNLIRFSFALVAQRPAIVTGARALSRGDTRGLSPSPPSEASMHSPNARRRHSAITAHGKSRCCDDS